MPSQTPNILCLCMDQLRYDHLGCYGNQMVRTPNLDRLAARGMVFDNAYVTSPLCMPARSTFFTGRTPRGHGVRTNGIPLDPRVPTMTETLRQAGYHTHAVGKIHLHNFGEQAMPTDPRELAQWPESRRAWDQGAISHLPLPYYGLESALYVGGHGSWVWGDYVNWMRAEHPDLLPAIYGQEVLEDWTPLCGEHAYKSALPAELHYNRWIADRTNEFLAQRAQDGRPFFCWTSFPDPHHPYVAPRPYCDWYDPAEMPLPTRRPGELDDLPPFYRIVHDEGPTRWQGLAGRFEATRRTDDELRHIWAMTYAMVSCADAALGLVLDQLEALGLAENTLVCFLADHGDMLGDHYIVNKGPFHFDSLLRMPMIWSWPGHIAEGTRADGLATQTDLAPTLLDLCGLPIPEGPCPAQPVAPYQRAPWPGHSLLPILRGEVQRVRDWVIVENDEDYLGSAVRSFITDEYKLTVYSGHPDWGELFDRRNDPGELHNLWDDPAMQETRSRLMQEFLYAYLEEESALPRRITHA